MPVLMFGELTGGSINSPATTRWQTADGRWRKSAIRHRPSSIADYLILAIQRSTVGAVGLSGNITKGILGVGGWGYVEMGYPRICARLAGRASRACAHRTSNIRR